MYETNDKTKYDVAERWRGKIKVTYSDGTTEEVYGFDVPVEALDKEFDLAILGTKGTWYDHNVSVSDPQKVE